MDRTRSAPPVGMGEGSMEVTKKITCPMYVENKVWQWDGRFSEATLSGFGGRTVAVGFPGGGEPLSFQTQLTWLKPNDYDTNKKECIECAPDEESLTRLTDWFGANEGWTLKWFRVNFYNFGILNMLTGFSIGDDASVDSWELKGNDICDRLDGLIPMIEDLAEAVGEIIGQDRYGPYHFGYPTSLASEEGISPEASYFFTNQFFLPKGDARCSSLAARLVCGDPHRLFTRATARTAANGAVWEIEGDLDEELLLKCLGLSSRVLAEWGLATAPVLVYTTLLGESLKRKVKVSSAGLRRLVLYNRYQLQKMSYLYKLLQEHEIRFCFEQRRASAIAEELEALQRAEETLELVAKDLDHKTARRSTAWIEWLVFVFTGMTSLSVLSDIVNYLSDEGVPLISDLPTRSILLLAMTGVLALLLGYTLRLADRGPIQAGAPPAAKDGRSKSRLVN